MRAIFVNKYVEVTGGADRHAIELASLLAARGHRVRFLSSRPSSPSPFPGEFIAPVANHLTRRSPLGFRAIRLGADLLWSREASRAMRRLIDEERPDVVHIHKAYPQLSVAPAVVAGARGVPIVQTAHDYEFISASAEDEAGSALDRTSATLPERGFNTAALVLRKRCHVQRVDRWIVASSAVQRAYAERGIDAEVLRLFTAARPGSPRPGFEQRSGLLFLGRLVPAKGVADVIAIARRHPELSVTVAGAGELSGEVERSAAMMPNLRLAGHLAPEELGPIIRSSRVLLVPSRWAEPAGLVALEAMIEGTPVVAYAAGGLSEYVESGGGGILVPTADVGALAREASRLHGDRDLWARLSVAGQRSVRIRHDPDDYARRIEAIYAEASEKALRAGRSHTARAGARRVSRTSPGQPR